MTEEIRQLLNDSVEKIAQDWIAELEQLRKNTVALEAQLQACVSRTKDNIEKLHALGVEVAEEARRGREICSRLSDGVAQITGEQVV